MSSIPEHWEVVSLKEVVSYCKGKKPKILSDIKAKGTVPYVDIKAFSTGKIRQYADIKSSNLTTKEDVLVVWDGARSGLIGIGLEGAIGSTIMALRPIEIDTAYLFRFLQTQYETINSNPRGSGIPHVDPGLFWNIKFPTPPLNEQHRIVAKLEKLLAKAETCQERLNNIPILLKRFRQSVLAAACSGRLTADWRKEYSEAISVNPVQRLEEIARRRHQVYHRTLANASADGVRKPKRPTNLEPKIRENSANTELPESWFWLSFEDAASIAPYSMSSGPFGSALGRKDYKESGIPVIRGQNIQEGKFMALNFVFISQEKADELQRSSASPGDIVVVAVGSSGQSAIIPDDIQFAILSQNCNKITTDAELVISKFVNLVLQVEIAKVQLRDKTTDTARPFLSLTNLKTLLLPVPSLAEQHEIVRRVEALFKISDQIEERYKKAKAYIDKITQSILARAFRGELVPRDANDEPAPALLERIHASKNGDLSNRKPFHSRKARIIR